MAHPPVAQQPRLPLKGRIAYESRTGCRLGRHLHPVVRIGGRGLSAPVLLGLHLALEAGLIHLTPVLPRDQPREVDGEAEGVVEFEGVGSVDGALGGDGDEQVIHPAEALLEGAEEGLLLFAHDADDEVELLQQLGEYRGELFRQLRHESAEQGFAVVEVGMVVADRTPEDAAHYVARPRVGGQLPVGDGEADGADMVGNDTEGHVGTPVAAGV